MVVIAEEKPSSARQIYSAEIVSESTERFKVAYLYCLKVNAHREMFGYSDAHSFAHMTDIIDPNGELNESLGHLLFVQVLFSKRIIPKTVQCECSVPILADSPLLPMEEGEFYKQIFAFCIPNFEKYPLDKIPFSIRLRFFISDGGISHSTQAKVFSAHKYLIRFPPSKCEVWKIPSLCIDFPLLEAPSKNEDSRPTT